ncbi:hypothetical protein KDL01_04335 [Actinospica durhamensis]|uniref:Uncharacterized protein n=1 Tax=Actinospica durhamensis TaxID=1508375 RepID=A0A941EJD8_9ACTN|nr:hypothetical protein [Actinospica durhamensis]MBR7832471.1 hypothetical protein [Actinospica durhamensis]
MKYLANNGITGAVILDEDEARQDFDSAPRVVGEFGQEFTTFPVGEYGHVLMCAAITYTPVKEAPRRKRRRAP